MALDFPNSPIIGQQFTAAGVTWTWDGTKWLPSGLAPTVVPGINDNRIINGDMRIDARNNGASGTASGYTVDRWNYNSTQVAKGTWGRNLNAVVTPSAFPYYLGFQSSSAYASLAGDIFQLYQVIEADAVSDFAFGTVNAQLITLSFWVYSSLTGTFSGVISNYTALRSYPFTYSIPSTNTWAKIVITIPGDTGGTWVMSGISGALFVRFDLGSGSTYRGLAGVWANATYAGATGSVSVVSTNAATFYLTGVKLEIGSVATPFNRQSLAKSMADCQRYYQIITANARFLASAASAVFEDSLNWQFMRAAPTAVILTGASNGNLAATYPQVSSIDSMGSRFAIQAAAAGDCYSLINHVALSAEL